MENKENKKRRFRLLILGDTSTRDRTQERQMESGVRRPERTVGCVDCILRE